VKFSAMETVETLHKLNPAKMLWFLLVYGNSGSVLSSRTPHFDLETTMEQRLVRVTQEVVRGLAGLDPPAVGRQYDRAYQVVATIYTEYKTQLDQLVRSLVVTDMERAVQSFGGVLDKLLTDGQLSCGRLATLLAFAGCLAQHCIKTEIISSDDVDQLAEAMGRQLATRLISSQHSLVRIHLPPVRPANPCMTVNS